MKWTDQHIDDFYRQSAARLSIPFKSDYWNTFETNYLNVDASRYTDAQLDAAARKLFSIEAELGVATIFWHQVLRQIATLADLAERVGNRLRLLMAA